MMWSDKTLTLDEALAADGEKLRQMTGEDHGPWLTQDVDHERDYMFFTIRALLDTDERAAGLVAATVSTVQSTNESRPAFVKRIVRAWLEEMANG